MYIQCTCAPNGLGVSTIYDKFRDYGERFWPWDFCVGSLGSKIKVSHLLDGTKPARFGSTTAWPKTKGEPAGKNMVLPKLLLRQWRKRRDPIHIII